MTDAEWVAEAEAERVASERFHALRKHNSSRRARQTAWAELERFRWRRMARAARMHPIDPSHRWCDFNDTAPKGWTYPALRTLERDEIEEMFPGALNAFVVQCDDIPSSRIVFDPHGQVGGKLRLSVPMTLPWTKYVNTTWVPEMGIWRRYQAFVKSKPYRQLESWE